MRQESGVLGLCLFLTGAALGATVALLYAPQSGERTRRRIRRRANEAQDHLEDAGEDLLIRAREMREAAEDTIHSLEKKVRTLGA